ncbi:hypothetical protein EDI_318510 [Entamoeba dispar SAW760]|uniref:Protein kinase domain-containing protein n=1 Tax=Entamoeba dispar (strain ATCC PRA-260 / SAW760) TaxID=370354 RepID=B0EA95_ENTDS|nr:uncharacterized protein EDI_318510 [Entamoeba dispar SAW760]EDR28545.1 hypothetical protein EDI_318510 [Entamoeba dispar SAW760]|eukprot:EDR28545.1 hypothetical protein EDI_318510 [Entamoeba dispar SAW760]
MELENLKQQFDVYLEIVGDEVEKVGENEWQTTIEDEHHSNISIILTFKFNENKLPYFTSSIELPPFSDFINFDEFKMKNNEMISNFLVDEESPFFNLYTTLKTLIEEWNDKQGESSSSLFERLERFDEIPIQDSTNESKNTTNYSQSVTIWKDFHYDTLRISTTKNKLEVIEKILDILKTPDYKYIEKYTIIRYYNDEIWLMKPCTGSVLFDIIFNIDNISQPLSQLMKAFQYLYSHGLFHGNVTKESIVYTPSSNVNVADWVIIYLLEGNLYPDSPLLRGNILKKDLEAIALLIEETIGGMNLSVQLTGFIQALRNHNSIDLTTLIKLAQQIPSITSNSSMFELGGEYEEASTISEMIGFQAYYRNRDNQFYCFQDIDLTRLPVHIIPEVKTRLYKFCQTHNKYFQYYFFSQPILMVRMSITEVPLNWYLQQKKLLQNKELTRKWFIRITSSIYSLHQESIGHGSLSLKHIFIKDDEIKLAFFDLITPISTVIAKDLISLKKLWIILGWYYFYENIKESELEKSSFLTKLQIIFPETINIQKAKSVEEIMSIIQSFDPKTKQLFQKHQESIRKIDETNYGFVCDLVVYSIQPTSQHEYTSQIMIISSIKSVEPLKLARNLRSEGFIIQTLFKEDIKMEEAKKIIKDYNCDRLILFDGGFKIINEDEIIEIKNINEVVLEIKSGNPINFEYTTLNKVDIGSIMYNETSIKDMHPEIIKAMIISFENEDIFIKKYPTIKKSFETNQNTKESPQVMIILKQYDEEYVEFIGKKKKKK